MDHILQSAIVGVCNAAIRMFDSITVNQLKARPILDVASRVFEKVGPAIEKIAASPEADQLIELGTKAILGQMKADLDSINEEKNRISKLNVIRAKLVVDPDAIQQLTENEKDYLCENRVLRARHGLPGKFIIIALQHTDYITDITERLDNPF